MNDLINLNELGITKEESKELSELTSAAGGYLPAFRIYGSSSAIVKKGEFPMGHFGLYYSADKVVDVGDLVDVLVIAYRARASVMLSDEQPVNYFDPTSENFIAVKEKGKQKVQGHMFGLEYLLYLPSVKEYACFFMGSPTLRRESDNVKAHIGKALTLKIKFIETKQYSWHGCEALSCDTPFDVPPTEDIKAVYDEKFANPKDSDVDLAEPDESGRER
jgi:hypothetical protein